MSLTPETAKKHAQIYISVFIALAVLTILTVYVAHLHLPIAIAVFVALLIATTKGSLVAAFFMHLTHEKKLILGALVLVIFFFLILLFSPTLHRV